MAKDTKPRLVIIEGKDKGKVITIEPGTTILGRTKGDVILQDPRVSRSHVSLVYDERSGKLSYTDLKSLNGSLVNGNPVETGVLVDGDRLQIGNTLFDCQLSPATEIAEIKPPPKAKKEVPLKTFDESSLPHYSGSAARKKEPEPRLQEFDEDPEPSLEENTGAHPVKKNRSSPSYRNLTSFQRNLFLGIVLLGGLYWLASGNKNQPPSDFSAEVTSLKQLEKEGKIQEALQKAEALSKTYDGDADLFVTLGGLYAQQKRLEPAIQAYRKAKAINPDHPLATVRLISSYLRAGMTQEADAQVQELDRLMKDGVQNREFFVEAANLFLEFRQLTQSPEKVLILSRALQNEFAIDSTIGYRLEAQLMFQQNQNEEAVKIIELGLKRDPQDEWLLENLAFARLSLKDAAGANEVVETWIRIHPTATKALLVMAYLKYNEKNYLGAFPFLQKIIQIANEKAGDTHAAEALNLMAQVYQQQGQNVEAKNLFTQACESGYKPACANEALRDPQSAKKP